MRIPKRIILPGAAVAVGLSGLVGATAVNAASTGNGQDNLVDRLASPFNLSKNDVQKVFDEEHKSRETARQQKFEERAKRAVDDGKISQDLADQLIAKQKEMQTYRDSIKDKSREERRNLMKAKMEELQKWLKDNNIDRSLLGPLGGHVFGAGSNRPTPAN